MYTCIQVVELWRILWPTKHISLHQYSCVLSTLWGRGEGAREGEAGTCMHRRMSMCMYMCETGVDGEKNRKGKMGKGMGEQDRDKQWWNKDEDQRNTEAAEEEEQDRDILPVHPLPKVVSFPFCFKPASANHFVPRMPGCWDLDWGDNSIIPGGQSKTQMYNPASHKEREDQVWRDVFPSSSLLVHICLTCTRWIHTQLDYFQQTPAISYIRFPFFQATLLLPAPQVLPNPFSLASLYPDFYISITDSIPCPLSSFLFLTFPTSFAESLLLSFLKVPPATIYSLWNLLTLGLR